MFIAILVVVSASVISYQREQADTSRPSHADTVALPKDSAGLGVLPDPPSRAIYYSDIVGISFDDSTSGLTVRRILRKYRLTVIGGTENEYVVRLPARMATLTRLSRLLDAMARERGVAYAAPFAWQDDVRIMGAVPDASRPRFGIAHVNDTTAPEIPTFSDPRDSTKAAARAGDPEDLRYRHIMDVGFSPNTSGVRIREILRKYEAHVIGGFPGLRVYTVQLPDPGSLAAADSIKRLLQAESGVDLVRLTPYKQATRVEGGSARNEPLRTLPGDTSRPALPGGWAFPGDTTGLGLIALVGGGDTVTVFPNIKCHPGHLAGAGSRLCGDRPLVRYRSIECRARN